MKAFFYPTPVAMETVMLTQNPLDSGDWNDNIVTQRGQGGSAKPQRAIADYYYLNHPHHLLKRNIFRLLYDRMGNKWLQPYNGRGYALQMLTSVRADGTYYNYTEFKNTKCIVIPIIDIDDISGC